MHTYSDVYRYACDRNRWSRVLGPNRCRPLPLPLRALHTRSQTSTKRVAVPPCSHHSVPPSSKLTMHTRCASACALSCSCRCLRQAPPVARMGALSTDASVCATAQAVAAQRAPGCGGQIAPLCLRRRNDVAQSEQVPPLPRHLAPRTWTPTNGTRCPRAVSHVPAFCLSPPVLRILQQVKSAAQDCPSLGRVA